MAEELSTYDALVLEKKWMTQDPKMVVFNAFVTKVEEAFDKMEASKKKTSNNKPRHAHDPWTFVGPKKDNPKVKVVNGKTYY